MKSPDAGLNRKAWGVFLLAAIGAAGWYGINLLMPDLVVGPIPVRLLFILAWNAVFLCGVWLALARSELLPSKRIAAWFSVALVLTIWIATVRVLAANGVFSRPIVGNVPSLPVAIILPLLVGALVLKRSQAVASLLDTTPSHWLVGLQVYRILGVIFLVDWVHRQMPGAFALPAGIGDVATGLFALPAAVWVASGTPAGKKVGIRWNLFGLTDFAVAVTMGMLTAPGPAQLLARAHPNTLIATFPTAITPAFVVPFSTLLHLLSLRQLKRARTPVEVGKEQAVLAGR